jgi:hypothetical protein
MVEIPSTGNIGLDISIAIVTGGVVTTWLTLLFDRLQRKRDEYLDISKMKMSKIALSETRSTRISSYLSAISNLLFIKKKESVLKERDMQRCVYYIAMYLYESRRMFLETASLQLDDFYSENLLTQLFDELFIRLVNDDVIGPVKVYALIDIIDDKSSFNSFFSEIDMSSPTPNERRKLYDKYVEWINKLGDKDLGHLAEVSGWCQEVWLLELNLVYRLFYGDKHLKNYYQQNCISPKLVEFLATKHTNYYQKLHKLKLL